MELWQHQKDAVGKATLPGVYEYGFLFDVGTGKTRTVIETLRAQSFRENRLLRILVITPKITLSNWRNEFLKFTRIPKEKVHPLYGSNDERGIIASRLKDGDIAIASYDSVISPKVAGPLAKWRPEVIVLDEAHKIKNTKTKRTKAVLALSRLPRYRYILTGTPVLNSLMDIFPQFLFLDQGKTFGTNFFVFRSTYFVDKNAGMPKEKYFPNWQPQKGALERINKLLLTKASVARKSEVLSLPPLVKKVIPLDLAGDQKKPYKQMDSEFITFLNESVVTADIALTKMLRLLQITSGFMKDTEGKIIRLEDNPKRDALEGLIETIHDKILIWAVFEHDYEVIEEVCKKFGKKMVKIVGSTPEKERIEALESFTKDSETTVFLGHPGAAGIGINLVEAPYMIYYSRTFSLENDTQSEARNYRAGSEQHKSVTRIDLVMQGTVDELCHKALLEKQKMSVDVLRERYHLLKSSQSS